MKTKLFLLLGLFLAAGQAHAITRNWTGSGSNNLWSNPNNWSPVGVPQADDDLHFEKVCAFPVCPTLTVVNDLNNLRVGELKFGGSSGAVQYVVNGNALRLTGPLRIGEVFHETKTANV